LAFLLCSTVALSGCEKAADFNLFKKTSGTEAESPAPANSSTRLVERDVEAPTVFQATEKGLWDGRPSLGGVWVAHPDVKDPERVIIRNEANGKFVIGALFRRERDNPGPKMQVSSDAAAALGMLAGAPATLNVTALRREEVPLATEASPVALEAPGAIETAALDPIAAASAAIDRSEETATPAPTASPAPGPKPALKPSKPTKPSKLAKPFIQIGLFNVEENAKRTADAMRKSGVVPNIAKGTSKGKTFWRVTVGPATNSAERTTLLKKIKGLGYHDAYFVTN
jgi:cell division septation protein DedD